MTERSLVEYRIESCVGILTLNDPPANTYSYEMMQQLDARILEARMDESVQVIVNTGSDGYAPDHPRRNADVVTQRCKLIVDPGPRTINAPGQEVEFSRTDNPDGYPMTFPPTGLEPRGDVYAPMPLC